MWLNLFLIMFYTGVVSITMQAVRHDYYMITTPATWGDAVNYCINENKILATVETDDDWERLNDEAAIHGLPTIGWIGLNNPVDYWYFVGEASVVNFTKWNQGQPDIGGTVTCAAINAQGYWDSCPCEDLKPSICYNATSNKFFTTPTMTWPDSLTYCQTYHTNLASANNLTQNNKLQLLVSSDVSSWFGLYRYSWSWQDGSFFDGLQWGPGFPKNIHHDDNCALVNNSMLVDRQCNGLFNFFCHTPYTRRYQVVKLKIKGDKSVFDPAVQSAILQNIIQKLKENDIWREVSVTWRVQPDGNIFQKESKDGL